VRAAGGQGGWQRHAGEEFRGGVAGGSAVPHHRGGGRVWGGIGGRRLVVERCDTLWLRWHDGSCLIRNDNLGTGI
jgi:hypothetical protein